MKFFTKKSFIHKMILTLVILISVTAVVPNYSYCAGWEDAGGALLKEVMQMVVSLGDAVMGMLNGVMLGTDSFGSAMLEQTDTNMEADSGSWLTTEPKNANVTTVKIDDTYMDVNGFFDLGDYQIPNMLYCPENIFANKIAALDINFLNPNKYISAVTGEVVTYDENQEAGEQDSQISGAAVLRSSIATWYKSFRDIAIVALLSVLVYLGIRILISTAASDKAKYKEAIKDWLVALCLVFVMHFIMSGIIMITDKFTELFSSSATTIRVEVIDTDNENERNNDSNPNTDISFYTNLTGLVRFKAQAEAWEDAVGYAIIYLVLIIYTCIFTFIYFKRFLYTAFFTMIAPLVAVTYPIDKAGDKKAQAFNLWFKEYTMNVIIQPVHLLLYTALVSSAMDLVTHNPLYALVAIAFLVPAEKFIKKMFGMEAESTSGFGSFAGGAMMMGAIQKLASGSGKKGASGGGQEGESGEGKDKTRFDDTGETGKLDSFNNGANNDTDGETAQNEEHQRMLDDREAWNEIVNDENSSDFDKQEAQEQIDMINEDMRQRGYMNDADNEQPQNFANKAKRVIKGVAPIAGRGIYKAAKGTAKLAAKTATTIGGGAIGLAAGLTTGDFSKAMSYMVGGAAAGKAIGNRLVKAPSAIKNTAVETKDKITNGIDNISDQYTENTQGYQAMKEKQIARNNERARNSFLKDENEIKKYKQMAGDLNYKGDIKDLMNVAADYKEAGIHDDKLIKNALKVEQKNGGIGGSKHKNIMDVASFTKDYGKDYIEDDKKRASLEEVVKSKVSNKDNQREIMETFADLHGRKALYKRKSGI